MKYIDFTFICMGKGFDPEVHHSSFGNEFSTTYVYGVETMEQACAVAKAAAERGSNLIELCGAFGEENTVKIIEATNNKVAVGYVTHFPSEDEKFRALFG